MDISILLGSSITSHKDGKLDDAKQGYLKIIACKSRLADPHHNLSLIYANENNIDLAIKHCKTAIDINESIEQYWVTLLSLYDTANYSDNEKINTYLKARQSIIIPSGIDQIAASTIAKFLKNVNTDILNLLNENIENFDLTKKLRALSSANKRKQVELAKLIKVHIQLEHKDDSRIDSLILDQEKTDNIVMKNLDKSSERHLLNLRDTFKHKELLQELEKFDCENSFLLLSLRGMALDSLGKPKDALIAFNAAIKVDDTKASGWNNLGSVCLKLGDYTNAFKYFNEALNRDPNSFQILNNIGTCLGQQGERKRAIDFYERALKLNPDFIEANVNIAAYYRDSGDIENAFRHYNKALIIAPKHYSATLGLGLTYKKTGLHHQAIEVFDSIDFIKPGDLLAQGNKANCLMELGEIVEARKIYEALKKVHPSSNHLKWNSHGCASELLEAINMLNFDATTPELQHYSICLDGYKRISNHPNKFQHYLDNLGNHPYTRSFKWYFDLPNKPKIFFNRIGLYDHALSLSDKNRHFYEFGVWRGNSFRYLVKHFESGFGFDTFTGIPEDWHGEKAGTYSSDGMVPEIDGGEFIVGKFEDTLPEFFGDIRPIAGLINFDADLYSSTLIALQNCTQVVDEKTILIFDEYLINDHWEEDEHKALLEYAEEIGCTPEIVGVSFFTKQVACRLIPNTN